MGVDNNLREKILNNNTILIAIIVWIKLIAILVNLIATGV